MKTTLGGLAAWAEAVVRKHRMASAIRVELNIWGRLLRRQLKDWWGLRKEDVKGSRKGLCVQRSFDRLPTSKAKTPQNGGQSESHFRLETSGVSLSMLAISCVSGENRGTATFLIVTSERAPLQRSAAGGRGR